jgi:hypothetical protein
MLLLCGLTQGAAVLLYSYRIMPNTLERLSMVANEL